MKTLEDCIAANLDPATVGYVYNQHHRKWWLSPYKVMGVRSHAHAYTFGDVRRFLGCSYHGMAFEEVTK